jgi:hypothetical protein
MVKEEFGRQRDMWLDESKENLDTWESPNGMNASRRRILITLWLGRAWEKVRRNWRAIRGAFVRTGAAMRANGKDDHLIRPQGYSPSFYKTLRPLGAILAATVVPAGVKNDASTSTRPVLATREYGPFDFGLVDSSSGEEEDEEDEVRTPQAEVLPVGWEVVAIERVPEKTEEIAVSSKILFCFDPSGWQCGSLRKRYKNGTFLVRYSRDEAYQQQLFWGCTTTTNLEGGSSWRKMKTGRPLSPTTTGKTGGAAIRIRKGVGHPGTQRGSQRGSQTRTKTRSLGCGA